MKVSVVGTGYVGLVSGACFAELGHDVICHDIDEKKIEGLKKGKLPIYEIGLIDLVSRNTKEGRLKFTTDIKEAVEFADIVMSAVGTPPGEDHKADLRYVKEVAKAFAENMSSYKVFINKSTVPVGTADLCTGIISETLRERGVNFEFDVVSNPEFLREGRAINDTLNPDRIVVGCESERARVLMKKLYHTLERTGRSIMYTDVRSAEVIKYASNSFLATKISFINEMANFCEMVGADVKSVSKGMGLDKRIGGQFLHAGIGYGGSCFPKDVKALIQTGDENGHEFSILKAVDKVNENQKTLLLSKFRKHFGSRLAARVSLGEQAEPLKVAIWGLSFKPKTDDLREAPALEVIKGLLEMGVKVAAFDPVAMGNFENWHKDIIDNENFELVDKSFEALDAADCLMILTEWDEFRGVDLNRVATTMKGNVLLDGRNIYEEMEVHEVGMLYEGIGRRKIEVEHKASSLSQDLTSEKEAVEV